MGKLTSCYREYPLTIYTDKVYSLFCMVFTMDTAAIFTNIHVHIDAVLSTVAATMFAGLGVHVELCRAILRISRQRT